MINVAKINYEIVADIKKELRLQGHYLTGELEASFTEKQSVSDGDIYMEAYAFAFLEDLEKGIEASKVPELNVRSKEFANLVYWVGRRGFTGNHFLIAKNIWKAWQREGYPLQSSKQYSKTGQITGAVEEVFNKQSETYFNRIDEEAILDIDKKFFNDIDT